MFSSTWKGYIDMKWGKRGTRWPLLICTKAIKIGFDVIGNDIPYSSFNFEDFIEKKSHQKFLQLLRVT